jgi:hypothetical protein
MPAEHAQQAGQWQCKLRHLFIGEPAAVLILIFARHVGDKTRLAIGMEGVFPPFDLEVVTIQRAFGEDAGPVALLALVALAAITAIAPAAPRLNSRDPAFGQTSLDRGDKHILDFVESALGAAGRIFAKPIRHKDRRRLRFESRGEQRRPRAPELRAFELGPVLNGNYILDSLRNLCYTSSCWDGKAKRRWAQ